MSDKNPTHTHALWVYDPSVLMWSKHMVGTEAAMADELSNAYAVAIGEMYGGFAAIVAPVDDMPQGDPKKMWGVRVVGMVGESMADLPAPAFSLWSWNGSMGGWTEIERGSKAELVPRLLDEREQAKRLHLSQWAMRIQSIGDGWPSHKPVTEDFAKRWEPAANSWALWLGMHVVRVEVTYTLPSGEVGYADISTAGGQSLTVPLVELSKR